MVEAESGRIGILQKKLEEDPGSKLFVQLAEAHRDNGDIDQAVEVCRKGVERNPRYHSARVSLGRLYLQAGRKDEATSELRKVLEQVPDNLLARRLLDGIDDPASESAPVAGGNEGSEPAVMSAAETDPMETETLAEIYLQQGHPDKAVRIFERILREHPDNESIRQRLEALRDESTHAPVTAAAGPPANKKIAALEGWLQRIQKGQGND